MFRLSRWSGKVEHIGTGIQRVLRFTSVGTGSEAARCRAGVDMHGNEDATTTNGTPQERATAMLIVLPREQMHSSPSFHD